MTDASTPTVPDDIDTEIEPDEEDDGPSSYVSVSIHVDGQIFSAAHHILSEATDAQLADSLMRSALAAAGCRGTGLWMELQRRIGGVQ